MHMVNGIHENGYWLYLNPLGPKRGLQELTRTSASAWIKNGLRGEGKSKCDTYMIMYLICICLTNDPIMYLFCTCLMNYSITYLLCTCLMNDLSVRIFVLAWLVAMYYMYSWLMNPVICYNLIISMRLKRTVTASSATEMHSLFCLFWK